MIIEDYTVLSDVIEQQAAANPDRVALVFEGRERSYKSLNDVANALAVSMSALGVGKADRVAILAKNSDRFFDCLFAANKLGAVLSPINWRLAGEEIGYILSYSKVRILFVECEFVARVRGLSTRVETTVVLDGEQEGCVTFDAMTGTSALARRDARGSDDVAVQMYTSGTTGRPKGAMITNRNLAKYCGLDREPTPSWYRTDPSDVVLMMVPTFHTGGIEATMRALFVGGKVVILREFSAGRVISEIQSHGITDMGMVPASLQMLIEHPDAQTADFSSLRSIFYGGAPMPVDLLRNAIRTLGCGFIAAYGMTEVQSTITALSPADHNFADPQRMRSVGKVLPGAELRIADANGVAVPVGEDGEIWVRGETVMAGYWQMPDATASTITPDGWLRSGDIGMLDEDGYLYLRDRLKDMIISGGENVYSAEVEDALFSHPQVKEVAVVGVPDARWGEAVMAVIVPKPGEEIDKAELIAWTKMRIASYKAPKVVEIATALPRNSSKKILKSELRRIYAGDEVRSPVPTQGG